MFWHNYSYRLKCIVRDKVVVFWTLIYPILLSTLFYLAFSNLSSAEQFSKIKIAVVNNAEFQQNVAFQEAIKAVSHQDDIESISLFDVRYTSKEEGDKLLEDDEIKGYIYFDNGIKLMVKESGINQTIIKGFIDDFMQTSSTINTILSKEPQAIQEGILKGIGDRMDFLKEVAPNKSAPDIVVNYYYSLIAMACMFGGFWGLKEVTSIQADLSSQGARVNVAPTHKFKVFMVFILAATTFQLLVIFALLIYLTLVLKISFGSQLGYIILTCIVSTVTGVTFGTFIASVVKGGEGAKVGILVASSTFMSFLSGMMYDKMKYIINTKAPILGYLNPANLITDCFYSLYYYDTYTRFYKNIVMLCGFIVVFSLGTYLVLRRQKYASL